jgi:hypothetical protein
MEKGAVWCVADGTLQMVSGRVVSFPLGTDLRRTKEGAIYSGAMHQKISNPDSLISFALSLVPCAFSSYNQPIKYEEGTT